MPSNATFSIIAAIEVVELAGPDRDLGGLRDRGRLLDALGAEGGELRGYTKVTRDLSDRRSQEELLRLSEERFRLLVEAVRDYAIFMLDPEGNIATWNLGAEVTKGYLAEEVIGRSLPGQVMKAGQTLELHEPPQHLRT